MPVYARIFLIGVLGAPQKQDTRLKNEIGMNFGNSISAKSHMFN